MALHQKQARAAALLGRGLSRAEVARTVGVDVATVSRWKRIADFQAAIAKERQAVDVENPTPRVVLEQALLASRADGSPAWDIRVQAARALASMPPDEPDGSDDPPPRTVIYVAPDDPRVGREEPLDAVA